MEQQDRPLSLDEQWELWADESRDRTKGGALDAEHRRAFEDGYHAGQASNEPWIELLRRTFVRHRTETHLIDRKACVTCQESERVLKLAEQRKR